MHRNLKRLKHFLKDSNKKPVHMMIKEFLSLWYHKKQFPYHYFGRFFYRKDAPQHLLDYMSLQEYNKVNYLFTEKNKLTPEIFEILDNKLSFFDYCEKHRLPSPNVFGHNFKSQFFNNGNTFNLNTVADLKVFFIEVLKQTNDGQLFIKRIQGSGGKDAFRLNRDILNDNLQSIFDLLHQGNFVYQEVIKQHDALNTIYSNAINTLRLETFRGKDHKVQLLGAFMRFGTGGIEVDNGSSGGFFVNLDMKQGTLSKKARNKLVHSSNSYTKHPDTGITFENFKIPYFNEAINLVLKLGEMLPCYVHGWDLAITNDGPLIIEGNHSPGILNSELSYYGFKQHKAFVEIMGDIKSMNNS